jgi:hypothetical protein
VQQSEVVWQAMPIPALALSGRHERQSEEMTHPAGHAASPGQLAVAPPSQHEQTHCQVPSTQLSSVQLEASGQGGQSSCPQVPLPLPPPVPATLLVPPVVLTCSPVLVPGEPVEVPPAPPLLVEVPARAVAPPSSFPTG